MTMKFYYAIAVSVQLLLAFISGDRDKTSYMLHLWVNLFDCRHNVGVKNKAKSDSNSLSGKSKPETGGHKYTILVER
jgi:hypothetical protein